jgi:hypothetical protein
MWVVVDPFARGPQLDRMANFAWGDVWSGNRVLRLQGIFKRAIETMLRIPRELARQAEEWLIANPLRLY